MENKVAIKRWQDQLTLLLGLWQFITPWVFDYGIRPSWRGMRSSPAP